jgi:membrane associated rhomboid family serine protease/Flp pilus assembly protein TadD
MTICASCGREFEASSDTELMCPQCAAESLSSKPADALPGRGFVMGPIQPPNPRQRTPGRLQQGIESPTIVLIALNTLVYLIMAFQGRSFLNFDSGLLLSWGANSGALTSGGQWWRLLTSTFEHGGLLHIALNMWCLYNLGWLAELLFGRTRYTLLYLMCGIGGSLGSICWRGNGLSVGASGAIFGIAGALIPAMMLHGNPQLRAALKGQLSSIALFVFYNLAFGAAVRGIDNAAHIGGLLTGLVLGAAFPTGLDRHRRSGQMRVIGGTLLMLLLFAGAGAYAHHRNQGYIESDNASDSYQRGDVNGAIAHAQRAAAITPQDPHAQFMLGTLLMGQHSYTEAVAPFIATTRLRPQFGPAWVNLCVAQLELKLPQDALPNCEQGVKLSPNEAESWFNLGRVRYAIHDLTGARDALAKAVELNPQGFDENLQYALMLISTGETAKALPYLRKARDLHPQDEDVAKLLLQAQGN